MDWFLVNVLSPLLLPIFVMLILGLMCDAKPDMFVKLYIELVQNAFLLLYKVLIAVVSAIAKFLWQFAKCVWQCMSLAAKGKSCCVETTCSCEPAPPPEKPKRRTPKPKPEISSDHSSQSRQRKTATRPVSLERNQLRRGDLRFKRPHRKGSWEWWR
jgi:hypothetical protein